MVIRTYNEYGLQTSWDYDGTGVSGKLHYNDDVLIGIYSEDIDHGKSKLSICDDISDEDKILLMLTYTHKTISYEKREVIIKRFPQYQKF